MLIKVSNEQIQVFANKIKRNGDVKFLKNIYDTVDLTPEQSELLSELAMDLSVLNDLIDGEIY